MSINTRVLRIQADACTDDPNRHRQMMDCAEEIDRLRDELEKANELTEAQSSLIYGLEALIKELREVKP